MSVKGIVLESFQLFRFEVIGELQKLEDNKERLHEEGFQLFRFEVIGELDN